MISAAVSPQNLLIVDDEPAQLRRLSDILTEDGFEVYGCASFEEALDRCRSQTFAVAILELRLHGESGIELLQKIRQTQPEIRAIIHTAYGSFDSAKDAVNLGAFAYLEKRDDPAELTSQVHRAVEELLSEALSESEQRYLDLLDDVVAIVWECDLPSWRFTFVSQHAESILGYPVAQWRDEPDFWVNHLHDDDRKASVELCMDCTRRGEDHEFEYRAIAADGRIVWLHDVVHVVKDESGTPVRLRGVMLDVTEKKLVEEALRKSEARYRSLVMDAPVCIHEINLDARLTSINPAGLRMIGFDEEAAVIGQDYLGFVDQADRRRVASLMKRAYHGEVSSFEFNCRVNDGVRIFSSNFIPIIDESGAVEKLMSTTEDITGRRSIEASLREREQSLARAQQIAQVGSWQAELMTGQLSYSEEWLRIVGLSVGGQVTTFESFVSEFVHSDDRQLLVQFHQHALTTGQPGSVEFRIVRQSDQTVCHVRAEAQVICSKDGSPGKIVGTLQNINDRKTAELILRESEEKFRVLTEKSPAVVLIARAEHIVYCNQMLSTVTGFSMDELLGMRFLRLVHPDFRQLVADRHRRRLSGEAVPQRYELKFISKDGEDRWLDVSAQRIEYEGLPAVLVTLVNITERKIAEEQLHEMESQLAHVSRLSTMGEMVAGIAHEINQPLAAISNFAVASKKALESLDHESDLPIATWLEQISQQAVRCGEIIRRLRSFVNKGDREWELVDFNSVIRDSVALIRSDIRNQSVLIQCDLPSQCPQIAGSKVQLQQVLVNLLRNGCEATNGKTNAQIYIHLEVQDDGARLTVEDNGPGVDKEQRAKLFDAFFTTKPDGMGIGLAISKSIIEKHQGSLRLDPGATSGARFHINLPLSNRLQATSQ